MRRRPTAVFVAIGAIALGVVAFAAWSGDDATADTTPSMPSTTSASSPSPEPASTPTVVPATPTATGVDTTVEYAGAVDPGMVLSGEHVVTSAEVFADTEAANGVANDK